MSTSRRSFLRLPGLALGAAALPSRLVAALAANTPPIPNLDDWETVRRQFPLSPYYRHLSGFYLVSHPDPVRSAIEGFRRTLDENPYLAVEEGHFVSGPQNLQRKVCERIASYLGAKPEEIALTGNTTASLAIVYHGLPLKVGDEVLTTTHDHVVHHESIRLSTERSGASTRKIALFDDAARATVDEIVGRVREGIRSQTRVLGITWVHSSTGIRLPVRDIAAAVAEVNRGRDAARRVLVVLDGVHGLGCSDENVADLGCDYVAAGTHKWMFAPRGTGILWARAEGWARLRPLIPSFSSDELFNAWREGRAPRGPNDAAAMTPGGFHAYEHQWATGAAFAMHERIGRRRVAERIASLNGRMKEGLASIPRVELHTPRAPALSAGICCFEIEGMKPDDVVDRLLKRRIIASSSPYAVSYARLSAGLMNSTRDVDLAITAVRSIAG